MNILESFVCLTSKLKLVDGNSKKGNALVRKYRSLTMSSDTNEINIVANKIKNIFMPIYNTHKSSIINKNYSFLQPGMIVHEDIDIGDMYNVLLDDGNCTLIEKVTNELLFLFYNIAPPEDRKEIDAKHKKQQAPVQQTVENPMGQIGTVLPQLMNVVQGMLHKHQDSFKDQEMNPSNTVNVMKKLIDEDGGAIGQIMMDAMNGVNPAK